MMTTSRPGGTQPPCSVRASRTNSRRRRFSRFRITALPIFLLTVKPMRPPPSPSSPRRRTMIVKCLAWTFVPVPCTRRKSARLRSRSCPGNRCRSRRASLLCDGHRETLATFRAATPQHAAASPSLHAGAETMGALAALVVRLIGTLHGRPLELDAGASRLLRRAGRRSIYEGLSCVKVQPSRAPALPPGPSQGDRRPRSRRPASQAVLPRRDRANPLAIGVRTIRSPRNLKITCLFTGLAGRTRGFPPTPDPTVYFP